MFIDDSYVDNMNTKDLVDLGQSVQGIAAGRITFLTVPTTGYMDEYGNEQLREEDNRAMFDAIINDDPLPEERNADNTPVPGTPECHDAAQPRPHADAPNGEIVDAVTTDPRDVTVQVSNSTGEDGLASIAASELQKHGFNVTTPDDYPGPLSSTTVFFSPGNEQAAATVASAFANPTIERVTGMGDIVQVVLGTDFNSVSPPQPSGSPSRSTSFMAPAPHRRNCPRTSRSPTPPTPPASNRPRVHRWAGGIHLSFTIHVVTVGRRQPVGLTPCEPRTTSSWIPDRPARRHVRAGGRCHGARDPGPAASRSGARRTGHHRPRADRRS